ncbi:hypothetical protein ASE23_26500 [Rhizobium sp. Root73]|nr:hypothetical protein ASD36_25965 [Rhizobium sp. Root1334]KRC06469.1 hypothetical protein ASE23_26500 [Rhizobium sp. Root73]
MATGGIFNINTEMTMMTTEQMIEFERQIEELRAEISACIDPDERQQIETELRFIRAELAAQDPGELP